VHKQPLGKQAYHQLTAQGISLAADNLLRLLLKQLYNQHSNNG
jgi:hypothetical protein